MLEQDLEQGLGQGFAQGRNLTASFVAEPLVEEGHRRWSLGYCSPEIFADSVEADTEPHTLARILGAEMSGHTGGIEY